MLKLWRTKNKINIEFYAVWKKKIMKTRHGKPRGKKTFKATEKEGVSLKLYKKIILSSNHKRKNK